MTFTSNTPVADIATRMPSSVPVFQRYGIDFCCGGKTPLDVACLNRRLDVIEVFRALAAAAAPDRHVQDWSRAPLHALTEHIVAAFHDPLRQELPRLQQLAARVRGAHGERAAELVDRIDADLGELAMDLTDHMQKEEAVLFPAIRRLEAGQSGEMPIEMPIAVMEQDHDHAGVLLARLRESTSGYAVPDWGCQTVRALYEGLEALEREMHVHVHLENNVLFRRAVRIAQGDAEPGAA